MGRLNIKLWARNADLLGANLTGADLNLTKLDATNFTQANLPGAVLPHGTIREQPKLIIRREFLVPAAKLPVFPSNLRSHLVIVLV